MKNSEKSQEDSEKSEDSIIEEKDAKLESDKSSILEQEPNPKLNFEEMSQLTENPYMKNTGSLPNIPDIDVSFII